MVTKKTGVVFFPAFDWAISPTHPEREERLLYTRDQIFEEGVLDLPQIIEYPPRLATLHEVNRVHFCIPQVQERITEAHLVAAGATMLLGEMIVTGKLKNGFALVRPPGHHAMRVVHGNRGFCNINNEAILVEYLRCLWGIKKVAIVDSDVHHGDGTQDIFYHDPDVLFISIHQDGRTIYPGSGFSNELGGPRAFARTLNVPLPPGMTDEIFHYVVDNLILPVLKDFQPDLIVNSAGQDNHYTDPLGGMRFTAQGYAEFTRKLNPHLAVLEGGYAIETALPYVNLGILLALAGEDYTNVREPDYLSGRYKEDPKNVVRVHQVVETLREIWEKRDTVDTEKLFGKSQFYERKKRIFYDTDQIMEEQTEKLRFCPFCPGFLMIDSQADYGVRAFCVSIPFGSCRDCQQKAYETYEREKKISGYHYLYLQDKMKDVFLTYHKAKNQELISNNVNIMRNGHESYNLMPETEL